MLLSQMYKEYFKNKREKLVILNVNKNKPQLKTKSNIIYFEYPDVALKNLGRELISKLKSNKS